MSPTTAPSVRDWILDPTTSFVLVAASSGVIRIVNSDGAFIEATTATEIESILDAAAQTRVWVNDGIAWTREHAALVANHPRMLTVLCAKTLVRALRPSYAGMPDAPRPGQATAELVTDLLANGETGHVDAALLVCADELVFRARVVRGYRVDFEALNRFRRQERVITTSAGIALGVDLSRPGAQYRAGEALTRMGVTPVWDGGSLAISRCDTTMCSEDELAKIAQLRAGLSARGHDTTLRNLAARIGADGRMHPAEWDANSSTTGRAAMRQPALGSLRASLRPVILPDNPGEVIVSADWSSAEPSIAAAISGDSAMIEAARKGRIKADLAEASGFSPGLAKKVLNAYLYGQGNSAAATAWGQDALTVRHAIRQLWPTFARWRDDAISGRLKIAETVTGRLLPTDAPSYIAVNQLVQGSSRDLLGISLRKLASDGWNPLMTVHDSILLSVPSPDAELAETALIEAMQIKIPGYDVAVRVETKITGTW